MIHQQIIELSTRGRGTTEITTEVAKIIRASGLVTGLANIFVLHTSCSVILTENADPSVRSDLETLARRWAPDGDSAYQHSDEGDTTWRLMAETLWRAVQSASRSATANYCWEPGRESTYGNTGRSHTAEESSSP